MCGQEDTFISLVRVPGHISLVWAIGQEVTFILLVRVPGHISLVWPVGRVGGGFGSVWF